MMMMMIVDTPDRPTDRPSRVDMKTRGKTVIIE